MKNQSELLGKWRHLIEGELLACTTPLRWCDLERMDVQVFEGRQSVLVAHVTTIGSGPVAQLLVACGEIEEMPALVDSMEGWARGQGLRRVMFVGRRGWLKAFKNYREIAVVGLREI